MRKASTDSSSLARTSAVCWSRFRWEVSCPNRESRNNKKIGSISQSSSRPAHSSGGGSVIASQKKASMPAATLKADAVDRWQIDVGGLLNIVEQRRLPPDFFHSLRSRVQLRDVRELLSEGGHLVTVSRSEE